MDIPSDGSPTTTKTARPQRYRSATGFNFKELLIMLMLGFFSLLFLALPWIIVAVEGPGFKWIALALGVDIAMVLFMWAIFGLGLYFAAKRPSKKVERVSRDTLRERLLSLNHSESPFIVEEVSPYHLVGRWKLEIPNYTTLFGNHGLSELYQIDLYLTPDGRAHALETRGTVTWDAELVPPRARINWQFFRGIVFFEFKLRKDWALDRDLKFKQMVDYTFNADEYKRPMVEIIIGSGWMYRPILFKPLRFRGE